VRSVEEIQHAHDLLAAIMLDEIRVEFTQPGVREAVNAALDALCWVLKHNHNKAFEQNLDILKIAVRDAGYEAMDLGRPQ